MAKAKYAVMYNEYQRKGDLGLVTEVRLERWRGPLGLTRYVLEWGTREPWEMPSSWIKSESVILSGGNEAAYIRTAIAKFDELTGVQDE